MSDQIRPTMRTLFNNTINYALSGNFDTKQDMVQTAEKIVGCLNMSELSTLIADNSTLLEAHPPLGRSVWKGLENRFNEVGAQDRQVAIHEIGTMLQNENLSPQFKIGLKIQSFKHNALNFIGI